jgi:hypothetical protein
MRVAIGKPGERLRQYMELSDEGQVAMQLRAGEVAVETDLIGVRGITADGKALTDAIALG